MLTQQHLRPRAGVSVLIRLCLQRLAEEKAKKKAAAKRQEELEQKKKMEEEARKKKLVGRRPAPLCSEAHPSISTRLFSSEGGGEAAAGAVGQEEGRGGGARSQTGRSSPSSGAEEGAGA